MAFDGDSPFLFKVHIVEHLPFCHLNSVGEFEQTVSQRGFSVVNMSNNTKVSDILHK